VVEEVPVELHHLHVRNGVILEDSSEEILAMPTPLTESHAFDVGASSSVPPVPISQAPATEGDDPDDSGDGGDDDDEAEEQENDDEEANNEQEDNFVGMWPITEYYTLMFET
jgi:ribosomal protein L12E/L44/L45/RPP1/RPP2